MAEPVAVVDMKGMTDFMNAVGPSIIAIAGLLGLLLNYLIQRANSKKLKAMDAKLTITANNINGRMTQLLAVISNEKLLVGEKVGIAKGMLSAIERQEAEAQAWAEGIASPVGTPIPSKDNSEQKAKLQAIVDASEREAIERRAQDAALAKLAADQHAITSTILPVG